MTTTRYFEVKVTGCKDCCFNRQDFCGQRSMLDKKMMIRKIKFLENKDQLTPSCPMWNETKESETK